MVSAETSGVLEEGVEEEGTEGVRREREESAICKGEEKGQYEVRSSALLSYTPAPIFASGASLLVTRTLRPTRPSAPLLRDDDLCSPRRRHISPSRSSALRPAVEALATDLELYEQRGELLVVRLVALVELVLELVVEEGGVRHVGGGGG